MTGAGMMSLPAVWTAALRRLGQICKNCGMCEEGWQRVLKRLAAYEDTGIEPGDVRRLQQDWTSLIMTLDELGGMPHLRELVQADRDGRLVVLPCEVGDTVWMIVTKRSKVTRPKFSFVKRSRLSWTNMRGIIADFGKTVFLTREEAEKAMEERTDEGNT